MKIKKVLVSQPKPASEKSPYYDIAQKYGVKIDFRPFIKVESLSAKEFRQQKVSILDHTAVIFTSRHAIDHFFHLCTELRVSIPETMKYFCVTEAVALYIQKYIQYRKRKIFFGNTGKFEDLLPSIIKHKTEKYLVPMSDVHTDEIKNLLEKSKIQHTETVMYRTVSNDFTAEEEFPGLPTEGNQDWYLWFHYSTSCTRCRTPSRSGSSQRTSSVYDGSAGYVHQREQ